MQSNQNIELHFAGFAAGKWNRFKRKNYPNCEYFIGLNEKNVELKT